MSFVLHPDLKELKSRIEDARAIYSNHNPDTSMTLIPYSDNDLICILEVRERNVTVATDVFQVVDDWETCDKMKQYAPLKTTGQVKLMELESGKTAIKIQAEQKKHIDVIKELGYFELVKEANQAEAAEEGAKRKKN